MYRISQYSGIAILAVLCGFCLLQAAPTWAQPRTQEQISERKQQLQERLDATLSEIRSQQQELKKLQRREASLERDISILETKIKRARLSIEARNYTIQKLTEEIQAKSEKIDGLNNKLEREKESLAQLIRKTNKIDDYTLAEIVLSNKRFSDFFKDIDAYRSIKTSLQKSFEQIAHTKSKTRSQQTVLEEKRAEQVELRKIQRLQKQKIEEQEAEKQRLLELTKGKEQRYQEVIREKEKTANEIRNELFALRDSAPIPFEKALSLARKAEAATGVRAAFLLGVLAEESNIGDNLGTGTWRKDMHPSRDRPIFKAMARELGFDPDDRPVSKKPCYGSTCHGWGGAMGPAQFIPSTWVCYGGFINTRTGDCNNSQRSLSWDAFWQGPWEYRASEDRIRELTSGNDPSNPWKNLDAFMASATLLADNGAAQESSTCSSTNSPEKCAALRYLAGWSNADDPDYAFYGNEVMELTEKYQGWINDLNSS